MPDTTAERPAWQFHRYSTTRRHARGFLRFVVVSAEYIDVYYNGTAHDVINTYNHQADEPTIYTRADFLAHVDEYMAEPDYITDMFDNL